ncbi:MAG: TipAS antibiotic-recognition domain-containing protein [Clostridia bacterium]|nr:TipAS antibiotic-recognition domain-containing protein [Clostridia bacterium]
MSNGIFGSRIGKIQKKPSGYISTLVSDLIDQLVKAVEENAAPDSAIGKEIAEMHKKWIGFYWDQYSVEAIFFNVFIVGFECAKIEAT